MRAGVVVPVHGFTPYLVETLDAVLGQTEPASSVVVVDDGSSVPLALDDAQRDRVRIVRLDRRLGPAGARNAGVAALPDDVDHVAFCDHDDVWLPGHLAAIARAARRHPDAGALTGDAEIVGPDGRVTGERWTALTPGRHRWFLVLPVIYERHPMCTSATVVRRTAFDEVGGFDETLDQAEDLDLWLRLLEAGHDLVSVLGATVRYRRHPDGLTHDLVALGGDLRRVLDAHADRVPDTVHRRAVAAAVRGIAAGHARRGEPDEARLALAEAHALIAPRPSERLRELALRVPGLRDRIGRRSPYGVG
ncbi:MAG: glycosyltransferase [Solirubrobacteraceae bacterium]|nr:glycosyltransferase [Solirubrobacteraceae bacterium]